MQVHERDAREQHGVANTSRNDSTDTAMEMSLKNASVKQITFSYSVNLKALNVNILGVTLLSIFIHLVAEKKKCFLCVQFLSLSCICHIFHLLFGGLKFHNVVKWGLIIVFLYSKLCIIFPHSCLGFLWQRIQNYQSFNEATFNQNLFLFLFLQGE